MRGLLLVLVTTAALAGVLPAPALALKGGLLDTSFG
jgi:hypothetical protein